MGKKRKNAAKTAQTEPEQVTAVPETTDAASSAPATPEEAPYPADSLVASVNFAEFKKLVAVQASNSPEIGNRATIAEAGRWVRAMTEVLISILQDQAGVRIPDLGTFSVVERAERNGVNPRTGAKIVIPAAKAAKFSASESLRRVINGDLA